jgi:hypothetical protein
MAATPTRALVAATRLTAPLLLLLPPLLPPLPLEPPLVRVLVEAAPPESVGGEVGTKVADGLAMHELAAAAAAAVAPELTVPLPAKSHAWTFLLWAS